jgi:hypothetical protein
VTQIRSSCGSAPLSRPEPAPARFRLEPACAPSPCEARAAVQRSFCAPPPPPSPPDPLAALYPNAATLLAVNGISLGCVREAIAVELGGAQAIEDGVDLTGAFFERLERPGVTQTYSSFPDALQAFGQDELGLSPEEAQRFAGDIADLVRKRVGEVADDAMAAAR